MTEQLLLLLFHPQVWQDTPRILFSLYPGSIFSIFVILFVAIISFHALGQIQEKKMLMADLNLLLNALCSLRFFRLG